MWWLDRNGPALRNSRKTDEPGDRRPVIFPTGSWAPSVK